MLPNSKMQHTKQNPHVCKIHSSQVMTKVVAYFRKMIQVQPLTTANSRRQGATLTASTTKQHSCPTPHRSDCHIRVHSPSNTSNAPHHQHAFPWCTHDQILMQAGESSGKRNAPRPWELATVLMWLDCPLSRQQWALRSKIWALQASISGLWGIDPGGCRPAGAVRAKVLAIPELDMA